MKRIKRQKKMYEGFSLVEMLVTMIIISFVFSLVSVTLTTLVKVSTISTAKTTARDEASFVLELIQKNVRNSNISDIYVFNISGRSYDGDKIVEGSDVTGYDEPLGPGEQGNEIHLRPTGYSKWVCIGYFPSSTDPDTGYILKSSSDDISSDHSSCFDPESDDYKKYTMQLSSDEVDVDSFRVKYIESTYGNYIVIADLSVEPVYWYEGAGSLFTREVDRQIVVSTQSLTW